MLFRSFPWMLATVVFVLGELAPAWLLGEPCPTPWQWMVTARLESLIWLTVLLIGPIAWFSRGKASRTTSLSETGQYGRTSQFGQDLAWSLGVGALAFLMAVQTAGRFRDLPPGLHDEFSYLFQAHTFLTGQTSVPSPPLPALFDQMHVLNDGRMASRYFPATGGWMVPFVVLGNPWLDRKSTRLNSSHSSVSRMPSSA